MTKYIVAALLVLTSVNLSNANPSCSRVCYAGQCYIVCGN